MDKETEHLEKLKALSKELGSDFFDGLDDEWLKSDIGIADISESLFKEYLAEEEKDKAKIKALCPDAFAMKHEIFKRVAVQVLEQSYVMYGDNDTIIELLPFVSSLVYTESALWIKIDRFDPTMLCAFANVCKGEYTYEGDGVFCARWEGSVWQEEKTEEIAKMLGKKGYKVM